MRVLLNSANNLVYRTVITFHALQQGPFVMQFTKDKVHQNSDDFIHSKDFIVQIHQVVDSPWVYFN